MWKKATGNAHKLISASDYNAYLNSKAGAWQNKCNDYILSIDGGGTLVKKTNKVLFGCVVQTMGDISSGPVRIVGSCVDKNGVIYYDWILTFSMSPAGIIEDHYSTNCDIRGYEVHKWVS